jgi:hypothetical protein
MSSLDIDGRRPTTAARRWRHRNRPLVQGRDGGRLPHVSGAFRRPVPGGSVVVGALAHLAGRQSVHAVNTYRPSIPVSTKEPGLGSGAQKRPRHMGCTPAGVNDNQVAPPVLHSAGAWMESMDRRPRTDVIPELEFDETAGQPQFRLSVGNDGSNTPSNPTLSRDCSRHTVGSTPDTQSPYPSVIRQEIHHSEGRPPADTSAESAGEGGREQAAPNNSKDQAGDVATSTPAPSEAALALVLDLNYGRFLRPTRREVAELARGVDGMLAEGYPPREVRQYARIKLDQATTNAVSFLLNALRDRDRWPTRQASVAVNVAEAIPAAGDVPTVSPELRHRLRTGWRTLPTASANGHSRPLRSPWTADQAAPDHPPALRGSEYR